MNHFRILLILILFYLNDNTLIAGSLIRNVTLKHRNNVTDAANSTTEMATDDESTEYAANSTTEMATDDESTEYAANSTTEMATDDESTEYVIFNSTAKTSSHRTTTNPFSTTTRECYEDFIRLGAHCYLFSHERVTWQKALEFCRGIGAELAHPLNSVENDLLVDQLSTLDLDVDAQGWWAGGTRDEMYPACWIWSHDRSPITFTDWAHTRIVMGEDECLMYAEHLDFKWHYAECDYENQVICQQTNPSEHPLHWKSVLSV